MKIQMLIALTLAGCSLVTTSTTPRTSGQAATTQAGTTEPTTAAPLTAPERPEPPAHHSSIIGRGQLQSLKGLSPDAAKQKLASFGYKGQVTVSPVTSTGGGASFAAGCADNTVCDTSGGSGIGFEDPLVLYLNPTLTIDPP